MPARKAPPSARRPPLPASTSPPSAAGPCAARCWTAHSPLPPASRDAGASPACPGAAQRPVASRLPLLRRGRRGANLYRGLGPETMPRRLLAIAVLALRSLARLPLGELAAALSRGLPGLWRPALLVALTQERVLPALSRGKVAGELKLLLALRTVHPCERFDTTISGPLTARPGGVAGLHDERSERIPGVHKPAPPAGWAVAARWERGGAARRPRQDHTPRPVRGITGFEGWGARARGPGWAHGGGDKRQDHPVFLLDSHAARPKIVGAAYLARPLPTKIPGSSTTPN
jgi:hypothetical protein